MFHSDLVYLRVNIKALKEILAVEKHGLSNAKRKKRPNQSPEPTATSVTPPAAQESRQP